MFKKEVKDIFWNSSLLVIGKASLIVFSLFSISLTTRILGTGSYGKLALFQATIQLFFTLGVSWVCTSGLRFGIEEYLETKKLNKTFWCRAVFLLPLILLSVIAILGFKKNISSYTKISDLNILLAILFFISLVFTNEVQSYLRALNRLKLYAILQPLEKIMIIIGLLFIWYNFIPNNVSTVIWIYTLSSLSLSLLISVFFIIRYIFPVYISTGYLKRIFFYAFPFIFTFINTYIFNWIDIIIIKKFMSIDDVGIYSFAYNGISILQQFSMATTIITIPLIVTSLKKERVDLIKKYVTRIIPQVLFFWMIFLGLCIIGAQFIISALGGKDFNQAILPFSALLIGLIASAWGSLYVPVFEAYEMTKYYAFIAFVSIPLNILGDFILIPKIGIMGGAISTFSSFFVGAALRSILIHKKLGLKLNYKILTFFLPALIAFYFFNLRPSAINFAFGGVAFILLNFILIYKFRLFGKGDIQIIEHIDMPFFLKNAIKRFYLFVDSLDSRI